METWISETIYTLITFSAFAITIFVLKGIIGGKLKGLGGYQKLANIFYGVAFLIFLLVLLHVWGILPLLVSFAATLGIIGIIFGFAIMEVWLSNVVAGVSLVFDKLLTVGQKIKIDGTKGKIIQMSLTSTKLLTEDGKLMVIPNKSFRERPYQILKISHNKKQARRRGFRK